MYDTEPAPEYPDNPSRVELIKWGDDYAGWLERNYVVRSPEATAAWTTHVVTSMHVVNKTAMVVIATCVSIGFCLGIMVFT